MYYDISCPPTNVNVQPFLVWLIAFLKDFLCPMVLSSVCNIFDVHVIYFGLFFLHEWYDIICDFLQILPVHHKWDQVRFFISYWSCFLSDLSILVCGPHR